MTAANWTHAPVLRTIFAAESAPVGDVTSRSDPPVDNLPADLASAHAMILAQREMLAAAQSEAKARALEIERLKLQLTKARHERGNRRSVESCSSSSSSS